MRANPDFPFDLVMCDLDGNVLLTVGDLCDAINVRG